MKREWLKSTHPIYDARREEWLTSERRLDGGVAVQPDLQPFDWEAHGREELVQPGNPDLSAHELQHWLGLTLGGSAYKSRRDRAIYMNFPDLFTTALVGQLFRKAPEPQDGLDFGTLGSVARTPGKVPTQAELVFYNTNGTGLDGAQWDPFWADVCRRSCATGHRWLMVESTPTKPGNRQDEIDGSRPFLVHLSPLAVSNWQFTGGTLQWAIIRVAMRKPTVGPNGVMLNNGYRDGYRLVVARGVTELGSEYAGGGWWEYDPDGEEIAGRSGTWLSTDGQVPMWAHYYQRDDNRFSRSGTVEIGNGAAAYYNLSSAADYDAWDAASSLTYMLGVDPSGFKVATDLIKGGSKIVAVPLTMPTMAGAQPVVPQIADSSAGAVVSGVMQTRLTSILEAITRLAATESSSGMDASGVSRQLAFAEGKSPRLALMATEVETSQNIAIAFLEERFGHPNPTGSAIWPKDYDLKPFVEQVAMLFELQKQAGVSSPTLTSKSLVRVARENGMLADDAEMKVVEAEYNDASAKKAARADQAAQMFDAI